MTTAGTVAAYLKLDVSDFNRGILQAIQLLGQFSGAGTGTSAVLGGLGVAAGAAAGLLNGSLLLSLNNLVLSFRKTEQSVNGSMNGVLGVIRLSVFGISTALHSIGDFAVSAGQKSTLVASAVKRPFEQLRTSAYGIMSNVGQGLINGLNSKKNLLLSTAKGIAGSVIGSLKSTLKIASPSKVMRKIGEQTAQGLALGLSDMQPEVYRQAGLLAGAVSGQSYSAANSVRRGSDEISGLAGRLDTLITLLSQGEQIMQVDGRAFARLIKEYS